MLVVMALSITTNRPSVFGDRRVVTGTVTFDSTYPAGGESLTAANIGLTSIEFFDAQAAMNSTPLALVLSYNRTTSKILAFESGAANDAMIENNTTDISAYSFDFFAIGK